MTRTGRWQPHGGTEDPHERSRKGLGRQGTRAASSREGRGNSRWQKVPRRRPRAPRWAGLGRWGVNSCGSSRPRQLAERPPLCPSCRPASLKWSLRATQDLEGLSHPRSGPCRKRSHGPQHEHSGPPRWHHPRTGHFILLLETRGKQALSPHAGLDPVPGHRGEPGPGKELPSRGLTKPRPRQPQPGAVGPNLPPGLNQRCVSEPPIPGSPDLVERPSSRPVAHPQPCFPAPSAPA